MKFQCTCVQRKTDMFERLLTRFVKMVASILFKIFFTDAADVMNLIFFNEQGQRFTASY